MAHFQFVSYRLQASVCRQAERFFKRIFKKTNGAFIYFLLISGQALISFSASGQSEITSLKQRLKGEHNQTARSSLYEELTCDYLMEGNMDDTCFRLCNENLSDALNSGNPALILPTLLRIGDKWAYYTGVNRMNRVHHAELFYRFLVTEAKDFHDAFYECKGYAQLASLARYQPGAKKWLDCALAADSVANTQKSESLYVMASLALAENKLLHNETIPALQYGGAAMDYADNLKDSTYKRDCYVFHARFYLQMNMGQEAMKAISAAFKIDSSADYFSKGRLLDDYSLKSRIHQLQGEFGNELERIDLCEWLSFCKKNNIYYVWSSTIKLYIFDSYVREKLFKDAISYYNNNQQQLQLLLYRFGQSYQFMWATAKAARFENRLNEATTLLHIVLDSLIAKDEDGAPITRARLDLYEVFFLQQKYTEARRILDTATASTSDINALKHIANDYNELSKVFAKQNDFIAAYQAEARGIKLKDSVAAIKKEADLNLVSVQQAKNRADRKTEKKALEKANSTRLLYFSVGALILALLGLCAWFSTWQLPPFVIRLTIVFSFVLTFELIQNSVHGPVEYLSGENPILIFVIDLLLGGVLGVIHHWIEKKAMNKLGLQTRQS